MPYINFADGVMGYVDENGVPVDVNSKLEAEQVAADAVEVAAALAEVEQMHAEVLAAQEAIETKLIAYVSDDAIGVTITIATEMIVSETTTPYPAVTFDLVT